MSHDLLANAARALRDEAGGGGGGADVTRMRIVGTVRARRKRQTFAVRTAVVLLAAAIGGTAWAGATGHLSSFPALEKLFGGEARTGSTLSAPGGPAGAHSSASVDPAGAVPASDDAPAKLDAQAKEDSRVNSAAPAERVSQENGAVRTGGARGNKDSRSGDEATVHATAPPVASGADLAKAPSVASGADLAKTPSAASSAGPAKAPAAVSSAGTAPAAREDNASPGAGTAADGVAEALYARAHTLHFQSHDYGAARAAWEAYLKAAPRGRYASFAHYNRAICLLRLGRQEEARRALQPFASGAFGGYRRTEAQSLLDAMGAKQP